MSKSKPLTTRITEDQYNLLLEFGSLTAGVDAVFDTYYTMREHARAAIKKQQFSDEEIKALADPLSRRVNLSLSDDTLGIVCEKHGANADDLKKKLGGLGALEMVFFADEFRVHDIGKMIELYSTEYKT